MKKNIIILLVFSSISLLISSCGGRSEKQSESGGESVEIVEDLFLDMGRDVKRIPYDEIDFEKLVGELDDTYGEGEHMIWIYRTSEPTAEGIRIRYTDEQGRGRYWDLMDEQAFEFNDATAETGDCFIAVLDPDAEGPYGRVIRVKNIKRITPPSK